MDARLYILAGALALVVLAVLYLLVSLVRAARSRRRRGSAPLVTTRGEADPSSPPSASERAEDPFRAALSQPLRTGDWKPADDRSRPQASERDEPEPEPEPEPDPEPELEPAPAPAPEPAPEPEIEIDEWAPPIPDPVAAEASDADASTSVDEVWAGLVAEIGSATPEEPAQPAEPVFEPAVTDPLSLPDPLERVAAEPRYQEAPDYVPAGGESTPDVAGFELPPLPEVDEDGLTPEEARIAGEQADSEHDFEEQWRQALAVDTADVAAPATESEQQPEPFAPAPAQEPAPEPVPVPTSEPEPEPEPVPESEPLPEPKPPAVVDTAALEDEWLAALSESPGAPPPATEPAAPALPSPTPGPVVRDAPEYEMAAPVEMWFGEFRIGVRAGTRTYDQFQRYASVLFEELSRSRTGD